MPKTKISEYSATANSNTDIASINIDEGCAPSGINNAIRAVMGHLKDFQAGTNSDSFNGPTNGAHNGTVGATTPAAGAFTTLSTSGNVTLGDASTDTLNVGNGGLVKDASGNVGIGTSSPTSSLVVSGAASGTPTVNGVHLGVQGSYATIELCNTSGTFIDFTSSGTDNKGRILYDNTNNFMSLATNGNERARIDSSGNLGIGTSSPVTKLDVAGTIRTSAGTDYGSYMCLYDGTIASYEVVFNTGLNNARAYRGKFDQNGNLLVGTTSNGGVGGISIRPNLGGAGTYGRIEINQNQAADGMSFLLNGTQVGRILIGTTSTSYVTSSDYRLKENVVAMTGALDAVASLKPCTYTWKSTKEVGQGFIAHELAEVCPQAVVGEKDAVDEEGNPRYQGIDTSFLVATLTAAIQELKATVDAQAARITALEQA